MFATINASSPRVRRLHLMIGLIVTAASASAADVPQESRGTIVAKSVTQIVRDHEEADWQDLATAMRLPELIDNPATWSGPFSKASSPRFTAIYEPPNSSLGIESVMVQWELGAFAHESRKSTISRMLTVKLRPDSCPTPAEMAAATGSAEHHMTFPGPHEGSSYETRWFDLKDYAGRTASIQYRTQPNCELTAFDKEDW
ncbi:hypothetical protein CWS35_16125 [Bradyrhizobium sp. SK17]|jgi:hypothetical protein|uniref:hypothetical protein n=1 Tax=Bradyrhizobium sp. SK17 TaxID=2057741 RepID=UPI000C306E9D|nr:hypothetical protein [Bradyrhizobium sp. SK17]AUC95589.1 hypothetical protein CWS35_16125 [Bradyrhizobium sp. SK17]